MTAQIHDQFVLGVREYSIVGVRDGELFHPKSIGLEPVATCTACWRGYVCRYGTRNDRLVLERLSVNLGSFDKERFSPQRGPEINGIRPIEPREEFAIFNNIYENLDMEIPFTGGMLLGDGFIEELYVHMGFHPAWKFQNVLELIIDDGKVIETRVVSEKIREIRERIVEGGPISPDPSVGEDELKSWIESTFTLDYDF